MARKNSTKKRLDDLFEAMKAVRITSRTAGKKSASKEDVLLLAMAFAEPVNKAFERAGLNIEDFADWAKLVIYFCVAAYGKEAGQPTIWSSETYERLLKDIAEIKAVHPNDSELECCKKLLRKNNGTYNESRKNNGAYNQVSEASTLRRALQNAKRWSKIREGLSRLAKKGKGPFDILKAEQKRKRQQVSADPVTVRVLEEGRIFLSAGLHRLEAM
jgi:hypothetical protein